jgi:hypothetical protein
VVAGFGDEPNAEGSAASVAIARLAAARARLRAELKSVVVLGLPWAVIATIVIVVATQVPPLRGVLYPTNLAAKKAWRTSGNSFGGAPTAGRLPKSSAEGAYFFHTDEQDGPWIEIDLGASKTVRAFKIENRADCCQERASPLVLETSVDGESWTFAARRRGMFSSWSGDFPARDARYVRLRSERKTSLHLRQVKIY